jgi:hypothetical protein
MAFVASPHYTTPVSPATGEFFAQKKKPRKVKESEVGLFCRIWDDGRSL